MNIFHAQFSTGQVVDATGVSNATLQTWLKRGVIVAQPSENAVTDARITGGGTPGAHRRVSFFNVMEVAVAKALIDAGLRDLDDAFKAARHFAHSGRSAISDAFPARTPSCPYDREAATLLAVRGDRSTIVLYKVGSDPIPGMVHETGGREGLLFVDVREVFDRIVAALGFDPRKVINLAYGREQIGQ